MKRDMDVVRQVMMALEGSPDPIFFLEEINELAGFANSGELIGYVNLLISGGYLDKTSSGDYRMTWEGHEFLDKVRDPEIWRKTKDGASKLGSWSVKIIGDMASGYIRMKAHELGLPIS